MPTPSKIPVEEFAEQCRDETVPLNSLFSYFCASPIEDDVLRRLLHEPVAAAPPELAKLYRDIRVILVPYLETVTSKGASNGAGGSRGKTTAKTPPRRVVSFRPPPRRRSVFAATLRYEDEAFLFLAVMDEDPADCHYSFYSGVSNLVCETLDGEAMAGFSELLREELADHAHGEIDEQSWRLKEQLVRRQTDPTRNTKLLRGYVRQSMQDTLTLYMHGLCCDIDLEAGPRQLNSRNIRRRLNLLRKVLPPPSGFALFPEELDRRH